MIIRRQFAQNFRNGFQIKSDISQYKTQNNTAGGIRFVVMIYFDYNTYLKSKYGEKIYKQISGGEPYSTNGRMELKAVVEGLKLLKEPCSVIIISDSKYICDSIEQYLPNWIKKGFKDVKHTDLWGEYLHLSKNHKIHTQWVKAHNGHPQNEHCDKVAKANAQIYIQT